MPRASRRNKQSDVDTTKNPENEAAVTDITVPVSKLKVVELRSRLDALGLSTKGKKAELVARLQEAIAATEDDGQLAEATAEPIEDSANITTVESTSVTSTEVTQTATTTTESNKVADEDNSTGIHKDVDTSSDKPSGSSIDANIAKEVSDGKSTAKSHEAVDLEPATPSEDAASMENADNTLSPTDTVSNTAFDEGAENTAVDEINADVDTEAQDEKRGMSSKRTAEEEAGAVPREEKRRRVDVSPPTSSEKSGEVVDDNAESASASAPTWLHITNLRRPFTLGMLRELIEQFGPLVPGSFRTDKIKTYCIVQYTSSEDAATAAEKLGGVQWPESGLKLATKLSIEEPTPVTNGQQSRQRQSAPHHSPDQPAAREWAANKEASQNEAVQTLEQLFRKTKAEPQLYWLPKPATTMRSHSHRGDFNRSDRSGPPVRQDGSRGRQLGGNRGGYRDRWRSGGQRGYQDRYRR